MKNEKNSNLNHYDDDTSSMLRKAVLFEKSQWLSRINKSKCYSDFLPI